MRLKFLRHLKPSLTNILGSITRIDIMIRALCASATIAGKTTFYWMFSHKLQHSMACKPQQRTHGWHIHGAVGRSHRQTRICLFCPQVQLLHKHSLLLVRLCSSKTFIMWKSQVLFHRRRPDSKVVSTKQTKNKNYHSCQRGKKGFTPGNLPGHGGMDKARLWAPAGPASQGKSAMGGEGIRSEA